MMFIDFSNWDTSLYSAAIQLLNFNGSLWDISPNFDEFLVKKITPDSSPNALQFKVLLGTSMEYATKAACIKNQLDILKPPNPSKIGPLASYLVSSTSNSWLQSQFTLHGIKTVNDINTKKFYDCLVLLKTHFSSDPATILHLDEINKWRDIHRNTDAHFSNKLTITNEYERIREHHNALLALAAP